MDTSDSSKFKNPLNSAREIEIELDLPSSNNLSRSHSRQNNSNIERPSTSNKGDGNNSYTFINERFKNDLLNKPPVDLNPEHRVSQNPKPTDVRSAKYTFDLDDQELLELINKENNEAMARNEFLPEEKAENGIEVKEKIRHFSEETIKASQQVSQNDAIKRGEGKLETRESAGRMSTGLTPSVNPTEQPERPSVAYLKPLRDSDEEDAQDDYRGGFFCGICTTRPKPKKNLN